MLHLVNGKEVKVTSLNMGETEYLSIKDAVKVSGWSRAYINKLVNVQKGDKVAKVAGLRIDGLGWLVDIASLSGFFATAGRKPGLATLRNNALVAFLTEHNLVDEWAAIDASVMADYAERKAQSDA